MRPCFRNAVPDCSFVDVTNECSKIQGGVVTSQCPLVELWITKTASGNLPTNPERRHTLLCPQNCGPTHRGVLPGSFEQVRAL